MRRASSALSSAAEMIEIRAEKTKMPTKVTNRFRPRKAQPLSPATVPASIVRISDCQSDSTKLQPESEPQWVRDRTMEANRMTTSVTSASQPTKAIGPAAMDLSKA